MGVSDGSIQLSAPTAPRRLQHHRQSSPTRRARGHWLSRWFSRHEPTTYQRFLAVHIHFAGPHSALS